MACKRYANSESPCGSMHLCLISVSTKRSRARRILGRTSLGQPYCGGPSEGEREDEGDPGNKPVIGENLVNGVKDD